MPIETRLSILAGTATVAYWPSLYSPATAPRWAVLAVGLPLCLPIRWPPYSIPFGLGLGWAALSIAWAPDHYGATYEFYHLVLLALAFAAGSQVRNLDKPLAGFALGLAVSSVLAVAQFRGWAGIDQESVPAGLFYSREVLAEFAAPVAVWAAIRHRWTFAVIGAIPVALCQSRIAVAAVAAGIFVSTPISRGGKAVLLFIAALVIATITLADPDKLASVGLRLQFWASTIAGLDLFGHGIGAVASGNFAPHSDALELVYELGIGSAPLLLAAALIVKRASHDPAIGILVAVLVTAGLSFALHAPASLALAGVVTGHLARDRNAGLGVRLVGAAHDDAGLRHAVAAERIAAAC